MPARATAVWEFHGEWKTVAKSVGHSEDGEIQLPKINGNELLRRPSKLHGGDDDEVLAGGAVAVTAEAV